VIEARLEAADADVLKAETALILHGFRSPVAIIAGLHRFAVTSNENDIDDWSAVLIRNMAEPMLAQVPAELADAFRRDWPLRVPEHLDPAWDGDAA
jgi:hypothetical protein